jgi:acetylglutamate kinase
MSVKNVIETLSYVKKFTGSRMLIKMGGSILDDSEIISALCEDLVLIRSAGIQLILVHGGGKAINSELKAHNIEWKFHQGQRITSKKMMPYIEMVLCGKVNKQLVRVLNSKGVTALGISGADRKMLQCHRMNEHLGEVGTIDHVDTTFLEMCLHEQISNMQGSIPVISSIGMDKKGEALNINADWTASIIAHALQIPKLIYLSDQEGIYDQDQKIIPTLSIHELRELLENGTAQGGMIAKINTIIHALECGIPNVHVIDANHPHALIEELFTEKGVGTLCFNYRV